MGFWLSICGLTSAMADNTQDGQPVDDRAEQRAEQPAEQRAELTEQPTDPPVAQPVSAEELALAEYRAQAQREARNYDRTQDISPRQLLILLEVAERTGTSLGQALATGEFESARTWNNFVRPTIAEGRLGSATGVWQFIPSTFYRIIQRYGDELLAASAADPALGREQLDLGAGPFSDQQVREIIQQTQEGLREAEDESLQLLRHNFTVLAFAKHYLSLDSGAKTPEEDYLFHFLGETRGRQILALARGEARHTLSVAPARPRTEPGLEERLGDNQGFASLGKRPSILLPGRTASLAASLDSANRAANSSSSTRRPPDQRLQPRTATRLPSLRDPAAGNTAVYRRSSDILLRPATATSAAGLSSFSQPPALVPSQLPPISSAWGLPADSPVVTGNAGMFYRDPSTKRQPYTWAQFLEALSARVQARQQPAMVRAKYGVGFPLKGGDMASWTLDKTGLDDGTEFQHPLIGNLPLPKALVTGPLDEAETLAYKRRLAELIEHGEDQPLSSIPPSAIAALRNLGLLEAATGNVDSDSEQIDTDGLALREALQAFRQLVGKAEPDDPAAADKLLPSERVALELYDQRIARYAALQAAQQAALAQGLDLMGIKHLLKSHQRRSRPQVARLQQALAEAGLQTQTRAVKRTKPAQFDGIAGKLTQAALNQFQLRNGLRPTDGLLDPVTNAMLGLPTMGLEIFLLPSGPQTPLLAEREAQANAITNPRRCEIPSGGRNLVLLELLRQG
jgi:peptidoglycan hydrolase-like protein with peptidoglycan-binding domain